MTRTRLALITLAVTGAVISGGTAMAATQSATDASGDAAQTADITRVTVTNGDKALAIRVKLAKATAGRTHLVATLTSPAEGGATYVARTVVLPAGGNGHSQAVRIGATLETMAAGATEATPVECNGIKATLSSGRKGQSSIRIPQVCFGDDAGTLVVDVATATASGGVADEVPGELVVPQG